MIFNEIKCHVNTSLGLVGGCIPCVRAWLTVASAQCTMLPLSTHKRDTERVQKRWKQQISPRSGKFSP